MVANDDDRVMSREAVEVLVVLTMLLLLAAVALTWVRRKEWCADAPRRCYRRVIAALPRTAQHCQSIARWHQHGGISTAEGCVLLVPRYVVATVSGLAPSDESTTRLAGESSIDLKVGRKDMPYDDGGRTIGRVRCLAGAVG